jgi:hypothetical protein
MAIPKNKQAHHRQRGGEGNVMAQSARFSSEANSEAKTPFIL